MDAAVILLGWYLCGACGGWLLFRDYAEFNAMLGRKYHQRSPVIERCPSPIQILGIAVFGVLGLLALTIAIIICLSENGLWYRQGRFSWWTTPVCKTKPE